MLPDQVDPDQVDPDQVEPDQVEPDQVLPDQVEPFHKPALQVEPDQVLPDQVDPLKALPKMSISPLRTTLSFSRWSVPLAASSDPNPVAGAKSCGVWMA